MVALAVRTLEQVWTRLALLSLEFQRISFLVSFTAPSELLVMDRLVWTMILYIFHTLNFTHSYYMTPLPTIFTLWYPRIHVSTLNSYNISSNIETPADEIFDLHTTLCIPNVNPNDGHI